MAVVNRCDIATELDQANGLTPDYDVQDCLDDLTSLSSSTEISSLQVRMKAISQEFDANRFLETNRTTYTVQARYSTGIIASTSRGTYLYT